MSCPCTLLLSCCLVFLVEIAFGLTLGFFVQSDEATGVVPFVVFILVFRMPSGLDQSWFTQTAEVVAVALEPCEKKLWNLIGTGFLVMEGEREADCRFTDVLGLRSPCAAVEKNLPRCSQVQS